MAVATSAIASSTYAAVNTEEVYTGLTVSALAMLGLSPVPSITSLKVSIKHPLSPIPVIGSLTRVGPSPYDQIAVTGSIDTVFEDKTAHDLFLNHTSGALAVTIGTVSAKKYTINIPKVYFQEGAVSQAGSGPISATFGFTGVYDGTNGCIQITRAVA
jgi:predicted transcriptional regulator